MKEYEVQVLDVNIKKMRNILTSLNGKRVHKNIKLTRAAFNRCNPKIRGFARVRSDDKETTMTVKIYKNLKNFSQILHCNAI